MVERLIKALIVIVLVIGLVWLALWALASVGVMIPQAVITVIYVLAVLCVLLYLWRAFGANLRL